MVPSHVFFCETQLEFVQELHDNLNHGIQVEVILMDYYTNSTTMASLEKPPGGWFNKKMPSYQHRKSHCRDKTILRPSYLHNGISYTGKMTSLYWIRAQMERLWRAATVKTSHLCHLFMFCEPLQWRLVYVSRVLLVSPSAGVAYCFTEFSRACARTLISHIPSKWTNIFTVSFYITSH